MVDAKSDARRRTDEAIRQCWVALHDLSELGVGNVRDDDLAVWSKLTAHRAVQDWLEDANGKA